MIGKLRSLLSLLPDFRLGDSAGEPRIREEGVRRDDFLGEGEGCLSSVSLFRKEAASSKGRSALPHKYSAGCPLNISAESMRKPDVGKENEG